MENIFRKQQVNVGPPTPRPAPAPRVQVPEIVEALPQDIVDEINKKMEEKGQILHQFLHSSMRLVALRKEQEEMIAKIETLDKGVNSKVEHAYKKMKLNKRKNINWRYDGKGHFVGREMPQKPQPPVAPVAPVKKEGE